MSLEIQETLTKKYGPLPGYAWAGLGAGLIVVVAKLHKGSGAATGDVTLTPASTGALDGFTGSDGGGGGGGFDLPGGGGDGNPNPLPVPDSNPPPGAPVGSSPTTTAPTHVDVTPTGGGINPTYPDPNLPAYAPIPGTATHPQQAPVGTIGSVPIQNIPPGSNVHQPGFQLD